MLQNIISRQMPSSKLTHCWICGSPFPDSRLALGPSWQPQIACDLANTPTQANQWPPQSFCDDTPALTLAAADLALPRLLEYANSSSADLGVRLLVALLMQQRGVRPRQRILFSTPGLIADITSSLRVTGQTSYIAASPGASSAASEH